MKRLIPSLAFILAACASPSGQTSPQPSPRPSPMTMDDASFSRELATRFQYPPPAPAPAEVADQRLGQIADAAYFRAFPTYDRAYSADARARALRLANTLWVNAGTLTHEQFVLAAAEITALADNGHTALGANAFLKNTPRIPVRFYLFADGIHVLYANAANADLLGARIDAIDGRGVEAIYQRIRRYRGGTEAFRRMQLIAMLESPGLLQAAGVGQSRDGLTLAGVLANGAAFERRVGAEERDRSAWVSATSRLIFPDRLADVGMTSFLHASEREPVSLHGADRVFWAEPIAANGYYIRLDHNGDADEGPIAPFLDAQLARVRDQRPRFVVLDMRLNSGGDYTTTYAFAHDLPAAAPNAPIYVLTSPWTFSAAITTVAGVKQAGGARVHIVGENVGDRLAFWAEGGAFTLPNTFLRANYTTGRHVYDAPCADLDQCFWLNYRFPVRVSTLRPDMPAPFTFSAYREGRDPALEAVLAREARPGSNAHMR